MRDEQTNASVRLGLTTRWGRNIPEIAPERLDKLLALSLLLGSLFGESEAAERTWVCSWHETLGGVPLDLCLLGRDDDVLEQAKRECGLKAPGRAEGGTRDE